MILGLVEQAPQHEMASKMKLLDEIVDLAVEGETSLPVLLRKCLVLSHRLKNERLKMWAEKELDGYTNDDALPDYRVTNTNSKGIFFGAFGSKIENQPIPTLMLKEHHPRIVEKAHSALAASIGRAAPILSRQGSKAGRTRAITKLAQKRLVRGNGVWSMLEPSAPCRYFNSSREVVHLVG